MDDPDVSVVIPTRNRPDNLAGLLDDLRRQSAIERCELIVVDDGSQPAISDAVLEDFPRARVIRTDRVGPGRARNKGWRAAAGKIVLFTDDDVSLGERWLQTALDTFDKDANLVGVEGPVRSPSYDPLFEYSVERSEPGWGLTCNVGYRRSALERVGGFFEGFPYPHCEDIDLALQVRTLGPVVFAPSMQVTHFPRRVRLRDHARRGRWATSERLLLARHPEAVAIPRRLPPRLAPLYIAFGRWYAIARSEDSRLRNPRRAAYFAVCAVANMVVTTFAVLRSIKRGPAPIRPSATMGS